MRPESAGFRGWLTRLRAVPARLRDESGNVAIITALLAPILVGAAGFAMDYSNASYIQQKMNRAAEAAVIGAVSQAAATAMGGYSNTNGLQQYGAGLFKANISQLSINPVNSTLTVVPNGKSGAIANVTYSANVPTLFSNIIGIKSIPVSGSAQATANPTTYINYYIVVDISQSMGIATTQQDMTNLYSRIVAYNNGSGGEAGCVFGCHVKTGSQPYSNEYLAHHVSPTITLRIDSAVAAIQNIISDASKASGTNQNIKMGLYTMSADPITGIKVNTVSNPSYDFTTLSSKAGTIDLGNNTASGNADSDFPNQLSDFNTNILPANGSGVSTTSPINYVFLITDGLTDVASGSCGHCTSAFDPSNCTSLKAKATVGVIYTTYIPIYAQNDPAKGPEYNYSVLVQNIVGQIAPNLQACASANKYYFEATDGPGIDSAMKALFASTLQTSTLQK